MAVRRCDKYHQGGEKMTTRIQLEPEALAFAEATAQPPFLFDLGPEKGRATLDGVQSGLVSKLPVDIEDLTIEGGPTGQVSIRILRPQKAPATLPAVVYIHGAGWVFGNSHTHDRLIRELAVGAEAAVVFPNYSLSPEAKYPTAIEESYAVVKWVTEHGLEHGMDPERLAVAGDSVGGNMTAAVTLLAKERGGPEIRYQALLYPVTNAAFDTDSYEQFAEGPWLTRKAMQWFWDAYLPDASKRSEATASPLQATLEQLRGLPPALVITDEADVLRDEGEAYGRKLRQAGVDVTTVRYEGVFHDFMMLNALAKTNATRDAIAQTAQALKAALS